MASTLITRIDTALDDLQFAIDAGEGVFGSEYELLSTSLRNIKIFLLSFRKLVNHDPKLQSLLQTMEVAVCKLADIIHVVRVQMEGKTNLDELPAAASTEEWEQTMEQIISLEEPIDQFYNTLLDTLRQSPANSVAADEIDDLFDSVLKNLQLFHTFEWVSSCEMLREPMKALGEQMKFLRNLSAFASESAHSKAKQDMFAQTEAIYIRAGYIIFKCYSEMGTETICREMFPMIWMLVEDIVPIHPSVNHTYTELLLSSKSGRRSLPLADPAAVGDNPAKEFLDSLLSYLSVMPYLHSPDLRSMMDQFRELYEGLGSLLFILAQPPNNFDLKMKDAIFDVIYDAGVFICSLYQTRPQVQLQQGIQDLLKAIRLITLGEQLGGEKGAPEPLFNNIPTTAPLSFVDFLVEKLTDLTSGEAETNSRGHAQTIKDELVYLRSFLRDIVELRRQKEHLQALWDHVLELVCRIERLLDFLLANDLSDSFLSSFDSIMKDIENVKMEIQLQKLETQMEGVTLSQQSHVPPSQQQSPQLKNEVVGYLEEAKSLKNRLIRGSKNLQTVPIVGMPGQGKTTLAAKIYNDPSVSLHFSVRAHSTVSQTVDKNRILLDLLSQIDPEKSCEFISGYDLVEKVWRHLKGRRYLIFLDDVWEAEAWSNLKEAFPDDQMGSRIMVTSRRHDVVPNEEPHILRPFTEEEGMELLQRKLFGGSCWPPELVDIGTKIVQICKGLPLTILIVGGILANTSRDGWETILGGLRSGMVSSAEQCRHTLELSYSSLPEHLRPCFLYFAAFAEDSVVPVQRLLRLWIAEGFVRKSETKRIEDVAEDYLKDLIEPQDLSYMFYMAKLLRVVDLGKINLGDVIPSEIGLLVQLAFLAIEGYMTDIPPLIGSLANLETLILNQLRQDKALSLPATFWNLQKLRHLSIARPGGSFPLENPDTSPDLCELDKLSGVTIPCPGDMEGLLKKFPNVRKLKFTLLVSPEETGEYVKVVVPESLSQLESLGISLPLAVEQPNRREFEFSFSAKLKKLSFAFFYLCRSSLSTISKLPNLEVLKFTAVSFEGNTWETEGGEFSKLRFLQLSSAGLLSWSGTEDQFECLEKLALLGCAYLEELPSCLENIPTLTTIRVVNCSKTAEELVQNIKKIQEDNGNSELEIITSLL
ncbi:OLC1v1007819C1 [Oldenlandia corymbosa var. corymbosa]|uniref:OLC1v1007819C1 n=1 Tax=Oldenlandia corymbosa var. corymbosa TaxID=529605 RepID=A0AAV1DLL6_OLDCO|nr:OLC1v1007819C1 [Oldenlandia corymbosa var. corymbosa]